MADVVQAQKLAALQEQLLSVGRDIAVHELGGDKWPSNLRAVADAAQRIEDLEGCVRAAVAELNVIRQIAHSDPGRVKMLAENAIEFLRNGIERQ